MLLIHSGCWARTSPGWRGGLVLAFAALLTGMPPAWADDSSAPATNAPSVSPSTPPSSTFLENHPELTQPSPTALPSPPTASNLFPLRLPHRMFLGAGMPGAAQPLFFSDTEGRQDELPDHLLVVYNTNDPDSKGLADYYASRRNIPEERVLGIPCPVTEEINRQQYEETIRQPIIAYLYQKDWMTRRAEHGNINGRALDLLVATTDDIWAIVLMRGVPLKILDDASTRTSMEPDPNMKTTAAAVDSELALLPVFGLPLGGYVPNPFFDQVPHRQPRVGPVLATELTLVTRLDGPKPSDVRRMIDDTIYAEQNRLAGLAVVDSRGITDPKSGYYEGDVWMRSVRDTLTTDGWSVDFDDRPDTIPSTDPLNQVALYMGWYTDGANGPWVTPPNRFVRGAFAYHLHSFSASTVRSDYYNWVGPLLAHGAAASMGDVYEPYLGLTPHIDAFTKHLLAGEFFAEAAYASQPGLSWMGTVIGDPLYRPFAKPLDAALASASAPHSPHDDWVLLQTVQREIASNRIPASIFMLTHELDVPGAGAVAQEGLGDLLKRLPGAEADAAAESAYKKAMDLDHAPVDRIRLGLKLAKIYNNRGRRDEAQSIIASLVEQYPQDADRFGLIPKPPAHP